MLILCVTIFLPTTVSTGLQGMPCQLESQVHSTNTLIDEVGLVEMEVGLDQLTWGDADLQRELRRLKDNSLKIPNLKYIFKIALLRVIPTLTHYSDIVSDISSGRICGIYVLTYYLTFFSEILFDILSGILSGIYSDILSGIYYILILPCHEFGLGVLLFAWINANGLNIHQMLVSHVCTQWLPLPLIPQNGQVLNLRVGPEKFSGYWKNRTLAQGLKKDVGGRFRYAVGLQSWVNHNKSTSKAHHFTGRRTLDLPGSGSCAKNLQWRLALQLFSQMLVKFAKDIPWRSLCVIPHESKKSVNYTNYGMNNRLDEWIKNTTDPMNVGPHIAKLRTWPWLMVGLI